MGDLESPEESMGSSVKTAIESLEYFAVENLKASRRYLVRWGLKEKIDQSTFLIQNKKDDDEGLIEAERIFKEGHSIGMISDAGCPVIADPGSKIVQLAHRLSVQVVPLTGPSSIFLALMASGMNGQNFSFKGYLPREPQLRIESIRSLERVSKTDGSCQIFMETPYRNQQMLLDLLANLSANTRLCLASNLNTAKELVISQTVQEWKAIKQLPDFNKKPTIFLLSA